MQELLNAKDDLRLAMTQTIELRDVACQGLNDAAQNDLRKSAKDVESKWAQYSKQLVMLNNRWAHLLKTWADFDEKLAEFELIMREIHSELLSASAKELETLLQRAASLRHCLEELDGINAELQECHSVKTVEERIEQQKEAHNSLIAEIELRLAEIDSVRKRHIENQLHSLLMWIGSTQNLLEKLADTRGSEEELLQRLEQVKV